MVTVGMELSQRADGHPLDAAAGAAEGGRMKRLTFDGNFCDIAMCQETPGGSFCEDGYCSQRKVWERLKQYEDMEEQGLLVRLPCNVGDTIYRCGDAIKKIYEWDIVCIEMFEDETIFIDDSDNEFAKGDIGKTVFLTREEAERALEAAWNHRTGEEDKHD